MKVRRIAPGDWREWKASRLRALADAPDAFASTLATEEGESDDSWRSYARYCSAAQTSAAFLARDEKDTVAGMVAAYLDDGETAGAYICAMWVAPESRNRGVGRLLIEEAGSWLVQAGANEVKAWISDENTSAMDFYKTLGFELTDVRQPLASRPSIDERLLVLHF